MIVFVQKTYHRFNQISMFFSAPATMIFVVQNAQNRFLANQNLVS